MEYHDIAAPDLPLATVPKALDEFFDPQISRLESDNLDCYLVAAEIEKEAMAISAGGKARTTLRTTDSLALPPPSPSTRPLAWLSSSSFVAPSLTKLCETRYARKQAEEKRKSGEEGNIVVDAFLVKIALHAFSLNLTGRGVVILLASKPLMTQSYVQRRLFHLKRCTKLNHACF